MTIANQLLIAAGNTPSPWDTPPFSQPALIVGAGLLALMLSGITVLHFVDLWQKVMGKRTPISVDIGGHDATGATNKLSVDVTGFVATKTFDEHREEMRLRTLGLEKQISDSRHDWRDELQAVLDAAKLRDEVTGDWRDEISEDVKKTALKLAAVEKQADMIVTSQSNMDRKLDRLIERHIPPPKAQ